LPAFSYKRILFTFAARKDHVGFYPTQPFTRLLTPAERSLYQGATDENGLAAFYSETIFYMNKQKPR